MARLALALVLAAAAPAALAGCLDGGRLTGSPEKRAYIVEADRLCDAYTDAARRVGDDLQAATDRVRRRGDLTPYVGPLERARDASAELARSFARLEPPPGDAARIAPITAALARQTRLLERSLAAARANDAPGLARADAALDENAERARERARDYGFRICGRGD